MLYFKQSQKLVSTQHASITFFLFININLYIYIIYNCHGHTLINEKLVTHSQGHISILKYFMWCHQKCALSIHPSKLKNLLDSSSLTQTDSAELNMASRTILRAQRHMFQQMILVWVCPARTLFLLHPWLVQLWKEASLRTGYLWSRQKRSIKPGWLPLQR